MPPRSRTRATAWARNRSEEAPRHCGSLGGKWVPISPSARAPRIGVRQGMQDHVAVRMGDDAAVMRNAHPSEPHVIAIAEGVHVEACAEAGHIGHRLAFHAPLRLREIRRMGELDVAGIALEHMHRQTGPFGQSAIVGEGRGDSAAAARRCASSRSGKRKACGVCTARSADAVGGGHDLRPLIRPP